MAPNWNILVVGCGGTGGHVAEGLCRLLAGSDVPLVLIDHDRVEPHNLLRQHFYEADVGKFKSQALAERLARQFGRPIGYSVYPFDAELIGEEHGSGMYSRMANGIIIGCVDNAEARRTIARNFKYENWWLDAGNGHSSGQVLFGNTQDVEQLGGAFNKQTHQVNRLPLPTVQLPSLLAPPTVPVTAPRDCAEAVAAEEQSPVINQAIATLVLELLYQLFYNKLTWMGAYIDLKAGTLQQVPAEPETVARMCGVTVDTLTDKGCSIGNRYRLSRR